MTVCLKSCRTGNVSASALFYSPEEKSIDESDFSKINAILEEESKKALIIKPKENKNFRCKKFESI